MTRPRNPSRSGTITRCDTGLAHDEQRTTSMRKPGQISTPFRSASFDAPGTIAVLHHQPFARVAQSAAPVLDALTARMRDELDAVATGHSCDAAIAQRTAHLREFVIW